MEIDELLKLAIKSEEESYEFYMEAMKISNFSNVRDTLKELAEEELRHKSIIESLMRGKIDVVENFKDLKLSDHLPKKETIREDSDLQEVLQVAMSRERNEYEFYINLKNSIKNKDVEKVLDFLANQELQHKAKLENMYDELVYKEF
ncbi:MAG: ferritin family protein [Thermoplasmata archaeon]|jgi:rubrerythrin|nr:ferritin family protein [Thermoplasmatales archaeon]